MLVLEHITEDTYLTFNWMFRELNILQLPNLLEYNFESV